ncbi:MAG: SDR family NAD(P)-dependent oxidoreductase [Lachnospiraceae bacterium]|nr:SDR family NAD(P)-dependent oxidoreductase [Lachnospiraceae bacterium]
MKKKTAIITGASGGIGSAVAKKLAGEGYALSLWGNQSQDKLSRLEKECGQYKNPVLTLAGDICDSEIVEKQIEKSLSFLEHVDVLIHCAGISHLGLLSDMSDKQWHQILDTNLSSAFYCCRSIIPHMVHKKEGKIIFISSVWGTEGASCEAAYSATKGGINSLTKALAKELAPSGIAVNALACGMIDTPMNSSFSKGEIQAICDEIPAGRMGTPEEVAEAVSLLTGMPSYLTGQIIKMDGGWQ